MKKKINNDEPNIVQSEYQISLIKCINYYNETWDKDSYKNATIEFALSLGIDLPKSIPDQEYRNIGAICRLLTRNQYIEINHYNYVVKRLNELEHYKKVVEPLPVQKVVEVKKDIPIKFIENLEDYIDTFTLKGIIDTKKLIAKYNTYSYSGNEAKKVESYVNKQIKTFTKHMSDWNEDIKDSYNPRTKNDIKKLVDSLEEFKSTIVKINVAIKQKPKKAKPASIQVKGVPYKKEYNSINGKHPKELIGKSFAVIYDTSTRDLIILHSLSSKFQASGMSFSNLDETKCIKKKLRKPEEQLKELFTKTTKKDIFTFFESIKTTEQKSSGRMSEDKIILGVY